MTCYGGRRRARWRRHGFGAWGLRGRLFGPGEARLALLSLLSEGPRHGYELMKQLERRSGGVYRASAGTVYPTLQQCEDEGLVSSDTANGRRVYRLTDAGRQEVEAEAAAIRRIWRRAEMWGDWGYSFDPDVADLVRPAMRLVKTALRTVGRSGGDPDLADRAREILERARRELEDLGESD